MQVEEHYDRLRQTDTYIIDLHDFLYVSGKNSLPN